MQRYVEVTPEWRKWLADALDAGNTPASLLATMVESHFDEGAARAALADALLGPAIAAAPTQPTRTERAYTSDAVRFPAGNTIRTPDRDVRVLMRMSRPVIAVLDQVLSDEECEQLKQMTAGRLTPSAVVAPGTGSHEVMDIRSSEGVYFPCGETELLVRIEARTAAIMHWPNENGEGLQVMHYTVGGEYVPHHDYFPASDEGSAAHLRVGGQRVSTLIMYLNDVEDGGETIFPKIGFSYVPRKGQGLYFEYSNSEGALDPLTLHGGAPVKRGDKWIMTRWMRERPYVG
jgi:prolyl 4-hydroxylase